MLSAQNITTLFTRSPTECYRLSGDLQRLLSYIPNTIQKKIMFGRRIMIVGVMIFAIADPKFLDAHGCRMLFDEHTYKSYLSFHFGSRVFLHTFVEWHCPDPSTIILAKGSGSLNRLLLAKFFAHSTAMIMI